MQDFGYWILDVWVRGVREQEQRDSNAIAQTMAFELSTLIIPMNRNASRYW
jgi:hypothetical protein